MNKVHVTTPIYYVNDVPHIGHAYTSIMADVTSRFMKMCNIEVIFTTGTDEHGSKVEKTALSKNVSVEEYVTHISDKFKLLAAKLNIKYDNFIKTTDVEHKNAVIALWNTLEKGGYIYLGTYSGWYSMRDEAFYSADELIDGKSPTGAPVEWLEEATYFFRLSEFQERLLEFYEKNLDFICPSGKRNEVISFLKHGLKDLSISRITSKWGIRVPQNQEHTIYVWLDALTSYLTAIRYPEKNFNSEAFSNTIHFIGKDILRFHAIYWPAFLMAANLPLPKKLAVHGWWLNDGEKISKSLGNVINPVDLINEFGLDQIRYFLLREISFGNDGNFTRNSLVQRINSELSNNIGNLIQRTLTLIVKNCNSLVPLCNDVDEMILSIYACTEIFKKNMFNQKFNEALDVILNISSRANEYIDYNKPWVLAKIDKSRMDCILYNLVEAIRCIALLLQPFIPDSAAMILEMISVPESERNIEHIAISYKIKCSTLIKNQAIVFKKFLLKEK